MTLIATPKDNELEATIALLPRGLSSETKVGLAAWVKHSSELHSGEYKGWIEMEMVASCLEQIGSTAKDISEALSGSCFIVMEPDKTE